MKRFKHYEKRIKAILLCIAFLLITTGCGFNNSISQASKEQKNTQKKLADSNTNITTDIWQLTDDEKNELAKVMGSIDKVNALAIAEKYYNMTSNNIESGLISEFNRLVTWNIVFDGINSNYELCKKASADVAVAISYTDAKNFYLSLSTAVFAIGFEDANSALNLGTAIATYYDDIELVEGENTIDKKEFYSDAISMYTYALSCSVAEDGSYSSHSLSVLSCMGNVFLDMDMFKEAYVAFTTALKIDKTYNPARTGLYNYYMANKQEKKALALISEYPEYLPIFVKAVKKISDEIYTNEQDIPEDASEEALEERIEEQSKIPEITVADFIEELDATTAEQIRKDMDKLKKGMTFKVPNLDILIDKAIQFEEMSQPSSRAALNVIGEEAGSVGMNTVAASAENMIKNQIDLLEEFGADVELGFDAENIDFIINDAIKNPAKYENWNPDIKISGIEEIADNAMEYANDIKKSVGGVLKGQNNSKDLYNTLAETNPEYGIFKINPYEYANPRDVLVQYYNMNALINKMHAYNKYWGKVEAGAKVADIVSEYNQYLFPLQYAYGFSVYSINEKNIDEEKKNILMHKLHAKYFPKYNEIGKARWVEATTVATKAYKKIEKYLPRMYSDCMKHIMLISDFEIRDRLEDELKQRVTSIIQNGIQAVITAYGAIQHYSISDCGCDVEGIKLLEEQMRREWVALQKVQEAKNKAAEKNFKEGILDENSDFYKKFIKEYEYEVNLVIFKYKSSPYKTKTELGINCKYFSLSGSTLENHFRNTTTYDGGLELGGELKTPASGASGGSTGSGVSIKGKFGFTATRGSDGQFHPDDVDLRAGLEASAELGNFFNAKSGVEASALRGTKAYSELSATGNKHLDALKDEVKQGFVPTDVSKTVWKGEFVISE